MEILISIVGKIAEYTVAPIGRQMGYLIFYQDNFKELKDKIEELEGVKERIEHSIEADTRNGREIEADVKNWLERVDEITEEAKILREDPRHGNVGCYKWPFPNLRSRHQLSRNAKKMARNIVEVQEKGKFDRVSYLPPLDGASFTCVTRGSEKLESRKKMKEDIVFALRDSKVSKIGVYGLGGVGKTTLVKEIAKQVKDDELFDAVIMVSVSQTPDVEKIQDEIADMLGLNFEEKTIVGRACRLRERMKKEKTILIILDNLWAIIDLEKLGIPSEDNHKGCKLLLTSRNQVILQKMETQKDFRLEVLNEEETWNLFEFMVNDTVKDSSLQKIATQVAKKCAGLPVLIVTVAKALKNKGIHHWKDALNQLERVGNEELNEIAYSALEFSYNRLEGDELKAFFLLCGVLGTFSWVSDLLVYGIGFEMFRGINTVEDARNRLYKMISDLKASCMLLEDEKGEEIRMHDIVCEVAISIASRDKYVFTMRKNAQLKDWPTENFLKMCTQIILIRCCIQKLPERLDCPNLIFFCLDSIDNRSLEIPHSFFEGMRNLKVLDLTGMIMSSLPPSLSFLTKLKTLCLYRCTLGNMAHMGALKNLEIFCCYSSSIEKFPSELGKLMHLKMLDLRNSGIGFIPSNIISKLTKLEELYMGNTPIKWEVDNSAKQNRNATLVELKHLTNLTALEIQIQEAWILPRDLMLERLERYKIVIGDIWEWYDKYEASKVLKLKLGTSIHLEHGIKALIKRVEYLYLDEINGISNVLYHLNGEGFPLLKNLHIQNNANLHHIIDSKERNQTHVFFPNLESIVLQKLKNLEKICHGPLSVNSFCKLRIIKVKSCGQLKYLFSVSMVKELSQLLEIEVSECISMKNIVFMESTDGDITINELKIEFIRLRSLTLQQLPEMDNFYSGNSGSPIVEHMSLGTKIPTSFFTAKVTFRNLETLKLCSINLDEVWDFDDHHSVACSVQNLANLIVEDCGSLKYLFSPSMIKSFENLKQLEISKCHMMEEIITTLGRNNETALEEVRFSKLEKIIINDMKNLKTVWHSQFEGLKILEVNKCEKLQNIFPPGYIIQKAFASLQTLKINDCALVEEIFDLSNNGMCSNQEFTTQLKNLILLELPKMKQIWSCRDPHGILCFSNLQVVRIEYCTNLEYLFPFSIAKNIPQLEDLKVNSCGIKEIVLKKDGPMEATLIFELNHLTSLFLLNLHKLERFYAGAHSLECQSLKILNVFYCKQLKVFHIQSNRCHEEESSPADCLHSSVTKPLFTVEEVIGNLEELTLNCRDANMILQHQVPWYLFCKLKLLRISKFEDYEATFPHLFLQNVPNLKQLVVEYSSFREIFYDQTIGNNEGWNQFSTKLKKLTLSNLHQLQHICKEGCQIHPVLKVLEILYVIKCSSLRTLVPLSFTFYHLTYLEIKNCNGLVNLITSSTATSLVKLETMKIKQCFSLEEIVTEEEEDTKSEIVFNSLEILELECLTRLYIFSSSKLLLKFPLLEKVIVRECPGMMIFSGSETSTPMLKKVLTEDKDEKWCWEGDLNGTINKVFLNKVNRLKHLELSKYRKMKKLWYGPIGYKLFSCLKSLVVQGCDWLSNVLLPLNVLQALSNIEELKVVECASLEVVFDLGSISEGAIQMNETIRLKKITLSNLPKLKHIWKQIPQGIKMLEAPCFENKGEEVFSGDPQRILGFCNLQVVIVERCEDLECLFPFSIAMDLQCLEKLEVRCCGGIKEIVAKKEGPVDGTATFEFNHLVSLQLSNLYKLERFYAGNYSLACQSLKEINVHECNKLELFKAQSIWSTKGRVMDDEKSMSVRPSVQHFFIAEEVIPRMEMLIMSNVVSYMSFRGTNLFEPLGKPKVLQVQNFVYEGAVFPNWLFQNVSNLEKVEVRGSSFKKIFEDERQKKSSTTQLKYLTLERLPQLQHICNEGYQIDLFEVLEMLTINECCSLINLVPSSISLNHLTSLKVEKCNELVTVITSSTARSLVKLKTMKIRNCDSLEQVITEAGAQTKEDIVFSSLEILELECLPRLICFSSSKCFLKFPLLEKIVVTQCPRMKVFSESETSTPKLQKVLVEKKCEEWSSGTKSDQGKKENEELCLDADLNGTINKMFLNMVTFRSFKHLKLSEYPELKELWYNNTGNKIFCNLKILVVHKCDFLSDVLFSWNLLQLLQTLEELEVRDCDSLEAVFDVKNMDKKGMHVKEASQLRKLNLSGLPNLKHIWNMDPQETLSFENLRIVKVVECQNLIHLFSVSQCQDLKQLKELNVESCGVEQIVAIEEVWEELIFNFPQLTTLKLLCLTKLKSFYPRRYNLQCPSLKTLDICLCEALQIFSFDHSDLQPPHVVEEVDIPIQEALFSIEKVSPNLKELTLDDKDVVRILNSHYEANLFHNICMLHLQYFQETPVMFLNDFLERFSNTIELQVRYSSFETLFPSKGIEYCSPLSPNQIKKLWLYQLEQLKHIWNDDSLSDSLVQNLESLKVENCFSLVSLTPPSISFKNLTTLEVKDCKRLSYLMTSSTVRSLMHLTRLTVKNCEMLEEAVMVDEGESEEEIKFERLAYLELTSLFSFRSFCSGKHTFIFSFLNKVIVTECPQMQNFSAGVIIAPRLAIVEVENGKKYWTEELNTTLRQLIKQKKVPDSEES